MNNKNITISPLIQHLQAQFPGNYKLKKHGKSFYFAQLLLPRKHQKSIHALYQVCRLIDDIGDNPNRSKTDALNQLNVIQEIIHTYANNKQIIIADNTSISTQALFTLINGVRSDLNHQQYPTMEALITYCYQVAGTVGLMMCDLMSIDNPLARMKAIDLGIAMQLTNIARDVWTDANLGRVYLPKTVIGQKSSKSILNALPGDQQLSYGIQQLLSKAEHFYCSGKSGISHVPKSFKVGISTAACLYQSIGKIIQKNDYFSPNKRSYVPLWQKMRIATQCLLRLNSDLYKMNESRPSNSDLFRHLPCFTRLGVQT